MAMLALMLIINLSLTQFILAASAETKKGKLVMPDGVTTLRERVAMNGKYIILVDNENKRRLIPYRYDNETLTRTNMSFLIPTDITTEDNFGASVAINKNNYLICGNSGQGAGMNGSAYVGLFTGSKWDYQKIEPADRDDANYNINSFGTVVDINEHNEVAVGSPSSDKNIGAVYIFNLTLTGAGIWKEKQKIRDSSLAAYEITGFGNALSISKHLLLIGAPLKTYNKSIDRFSGAVYIYNKSNPADLWQLQIMLKPPVINGGFGGAVSMSGGRLFIAAQDVDDGKGCVYVYISSNGSWTQETKLVASDRNVVREFGSYLSAYDNKLVVAVLNKGKAYLFQLKETWQETMQFGELRSRSVFMAVGIYNNTIAVVEPKGVRMFDIAEKSKNTSSSKSLLPYCLHSYLVFIIFYLFH